MTNKNGLPDPKNVIDAEELRGLVSTALEEVDQVYYKFTEQLEGKYPGKGNIGLRQLAAHTFFTRCVALAAARQPMLFTHSIIISALYRCHKFIDQIKQDVGDKYVDYSTVVTCQTPEEAEEVVASGATVIAEEREAVPTDDVVNFSDKDIEA